MQNAALAQVFDTIADYLELAGENPFKIRAFRRAAEAVAAHPTPIEETVDNNALEKIEGIGKGTAAIAREFLATGQAQTLEELREKYPPGLLEVLRVPGLGPKKVATLHQQAQIGSIEDLKSALQQGRLAAVPGFGAASLKNLETSLERMAQMSRQLPLGDALVFVDNIVALLAEVPAVQRSAVCGSARRGCDTVDSVNLLVATPDPAAALAAFMALPAVLAVESCDDTVASVKARGGVAAELTCVAPEKFGASLFFRTGTAQHVQCAQELARQNGYELSQDGLLRDGVPLPMADESALYAALGVPYIPPELRENRGEWQAAQRGSLPQLVETSEIRGELHAHSTWSDGRHTIRQMAQAARERGYEYHVISDHSKALAMAGGLDAARLRQQAEEIAAVQAEFPDVKLLRGVECDILRDGSMDLDDDILHELDIVIASVHSAFNLDEATQTARMIRAIQHPAVDIVAHPTGRVLGVRPGYAVNVEALIEAAAAHDTALEINASERLDLSDENAFKAREAGVLLAINTDAHSVRMLENVRLGVLTARRAWCGKADILNCKSAKDLLTWLQRPAALR